MGRLAAALSTGREGLSGSTKLALQNLKIPDAAPLADGSSYVPRRKHGAASDSGKAARFTVYGLLAVIIGVALSGGPIDVPRALHGFPQSAAALGIRMSSVASSAASAPMAVGSLSPDQELTKDLHSAAASSSKVVTVEGKRRRPNRVKVLEEKHMMAAHIKEGCDWQTDGYELCAKSSESYEILRAYGERRRLTFICFAVAILLMVMLIQWIVRLATEGVSRSRDRHLKTYEEAVFKQIACVLMVVAVLEIFIQSRALGIPLEEKFFGSIATEFPWFTSFLQISHVDLVLDFLLVVTLIFASCFLVMSVFLAFSGYKINRWLRHADAVDVHNASNKVEGGASEVEYLALRYEFEDAVQQSCVPGLDPPGLYFQNYCRACAYHVAADLLVVPASTLLLAFLLTLPISAIPMEKLVHKTEVIVMTCLAGFPLVCTLIASFRVWLLKRQLLPRDQFKFITIRLAWDHGSSADALMVGPTDDITPPYRQRKTPRSTCLPGAVANVLYGTRYPNNHEGLYFFWRRGPGVLTQFCQLAIFMQLVVLSFTLTLIDAHKDVWLFKHWPWAPITVVGLCVLQWVLIPSLLWNLTVVTCTGGLIKDNVLQEVWETQRARTVQRFRVLIDCLRCEANLCRIERGGRQLRDNWNDRAQFDDAVNVRVDDAVYKKLDPDRDGLLRRGHIYTFLSSEGLPVRSEKDAQRWIAAFDRKNKGGLDREDFGVLAWNVRILLGNELDIDAVSVLFSEKYALPLDGRLDVPTLAALFEKWHLHWTKVHLMHLFQYMTGRRGTQSMNVRQFLQSLHVLEANTIGTLRQAVGDLTTQSDSSLESSRSDDSLQTQ